MAVPAHAGLGLVPPYSTEVELRYQVYIQHIHDMAMSIYTCWLAQQLRKYFIVYCCWFISVIILMALHVLTIALSVTTAI